MSAPAYTLWKRRWTRVRTSSDFAALEAEGRDIAENEDHDTCVYEVGIDPNDEDDDEWEVG